MGVPHMLHKSYMTRASADSAYAYAMSRGWIRHWQGCILTSLQVPQIVMLKPEVSLTRPENAYKTPLNAGQAMDA